MTETVSTVEHMMREFLTASTKHTAAACDPTTPKEDFGTHCALAQAYGVTAYVLHAFDQTGEDSTELAWELYDFLGNGEPLAEWVGERLTNYRVNVDALITQTQGNPLPIEPLTTEPAPH